MDQVLLEMFSLSTKKNQQWGSHSNWCHVKMQDVRQAIQCPWQNTGSWWIWVGSRCEQACDSQWGCLEHIHREVGVNAFTFVNYSCTWISLGGWFGLMIILQKNKTAACYQNKVIKKLGRNKPNILQRSFFHNWRCQRRCWEWPRVSNEGCRRCPWPYSKFTFNVCT